MADITLYDFKLIDQELFDSLAESKPQDEQQNHNYCPDCSIPMIISQNEYQCPSCRLLQNFEADMSGPICGNRVENGNSNIRISTGRYKGKFYNMNGDYTRIQKRHIELQLFQLNVAYKGPQIARNILLKAAAGYNAAQQLIIDIHDPYSGVTSHKKFVKRGNIKEEVLAGFVYFECIRAGAARKKKDIAAFMNLTNNGFSRGEDILRTLYAEGKIDIPIDNEPMEDFVDRYLEALNIENPQYKGFIIDIVNLSEERKIAMNSHISSKIVGAIWIIITHLNLNITPAALEVAADNTKKNTFIKFQGTVKSNMRLFMPIFSKWKIPVLSTSASEY